jgi:threonine dehydratase
MSEHLVTLDSIRAARKRIEDSIYLSPCPYSLALSRLCGCSIYSKLDNLQVTGSFKERGARNKLLRLPPERRSRGVVAASAGNHALGLAYHGQLLGVPVTVYMPKSAPLVKVSNCRSFGAEVILEGETYDQARQKALAVAGQADRTYVSGFDDPDIIDGQGTMGLEIIEQVPDLDAVIVPVGGGGLIAGVGTAIKALRPAVRVIGVESTHAPTLRASLDAGRVTRIETRPSLADGLAVAQIGSLCFDIAQKVVDDLVMVDEPQIAAAILRLLEREKTVVEGAGATPLAAAMGPLDGFGGFDKLTAGELTADKLAATPSIKSLGLEGKKVVLCLCGGNIDVTLISRIIERGLAADGRLCRAVIYISDRPGSLAELLRVIATTGASIKQVEHDRSFGPADVARVAVSVIMETRDAGHIQEVRQAIRAAHFEEVD